MNKVIIYSTGCPRCNVLVKKLQQKNIEFIEINDSQLMLSKGIESVPQLEVDGQLLDFLAANAWVNQQEA